MTLPSFPHQTPVVPIQNPPHVQLRRPHSASASRQALCYVGGDTRIIVIDRRNPSLSSFLSHLCKHSTSLSPSPSSTSSPTRTSTPSSPSPPPTTLRT
ncbi:hypothetical protein MLD38_037911 [Melastoma candidum]|uniref:Uncharacterized protein n=1 Tax=Melastoma candidum TaxID=119954 RepID=A0ACB9KXK5_9MYRT|nr:hypothetical protein MLD38_037911 [Melastoma candidum]